MLRPELAEYLTLKQLYSSRQSIATIQLTPEEAERYRSCPVVLDFTSGFYIFPVCSVIFYIFFAG